MKKLNITKVLFTGISCVLSIYSCKKNQPPQQQQQQFNVVQTNLVADTAGYNAAKIDTNIPNAWGLAANPNGIIWVVSNHKGLSTIYDQTGQPLREPVQIPSVDPLQPGAPTGIVFNGGTSFGGNKFIFAGEDGVITAWKMNDNAAEVADHSELGAVYKGLAIATDGNADFLYAANFKGKKIDVFNNEFQYVTTKPFTDPNMPDGFGPFNIQNIGGMLYVTYAKLKGPDNEDDDAAPGNGYVDIFKPDGTLVKRFASQGPLNSPWGITHAPAGFAGDAETILVGNFGDGRIIVFDLAGNYKGQLASNGKTLGLEGLWALDFLKANATAADPLYFTAGPGGEKHGIFGSLKTSK